MTNDHRDIPKTGEWTVTNAGSKIFSFPSPDKDMTIEVNNRDTNQTMDTKEKPMGKIESCFSQTKIK